MKNVIIAVIGKSGSGKTAATEFASKALGVSVVRSYTTRPMREGEQQGVEHIFVPEGCVLPRREDMVAYTFFGGYHYWALTSQVERDSYCLYVIDEDGIRDLSARFGDRYVLIPVLIESRCQYADEARKSRDEGRKPLGAYYATIANDGAKEKLFYHFTQAVEEIMSNERIAEWFDSNRKVF